MSPKCHYKPLFLPYQVLKNVKLKVQDKYFNQDKHFCIALGFNELNWNLVSTSGEPNWQKFKI